MICVSEPVLDLVLPDTGPRAEGVHLSGIIRSMAMELGILKEKWIEDRAEVLSLSDTLTFPEDPMLRQAALLRMSIGLAWEEWYIRTQLPHVVAHPGEMTVDGISMNPDGESLDVIITEGQRGKFYLRLHEIKTTSKSIHTVGLTGVPSKYSTDAQPMETQLMWLWQDKGYLKGAGTRFLTQHVLFLYGDYQQPYRPQLHRFHLEFTDEEIERNWELMRDYRDHRLIQGNL